MRLFRCICLILHRRLLIKKQTKHIKINIICFSMRRQVSGQSRRKEMHFFDMCRTERRRLFNISICGKTILIAVCVLAMGVLTFINENPNIEMTDKYFYELFRLYFSRGTFFQLLFVPVGYYIMYGICTDLKEKMSYFFCDKVKYQCLYSC